MIQWNEDQSDGLEMVMPHYIKAMGQLIKQAREDMKLTQGQLAKYLKRRQAYVSDLETGKTEATSSILITLSLILQKPVTYFIPENARSMPGTRTLTEDELSLDESEILKLLRQLDPQLTNYRIALHLLRAFIEYENNAQNDYFADTANQ